MLDPLDIIRAVRQLDYWAARLLHLDIFFLGAWPPVAGMVTDLAGSVTNSCSVYAQC